MAPVLTAELRTRKRGGDFSLAITCPHTPRGRPAPQPFPVQFLFATFATTFDQMIRWVIIEKSKDRFQNNNYRVQTLENKAPTLPKSRVRGVPVSPAKRGQASLSEGFLGYRHCSSNPNSNCTAVTSHRLKLPEDVKHSVSTIKLNTLSHAKLLSDSGLKVCTVCKTCSL